jgi:hypothetical protein
MSPAYDPRRSRPRPAVADDDEAPIDALLGPAPDAEPATEPAVPSVPSDTPEATSPRSVPSVPSRSPAPQTGAPSKLVQLAPLLAATALVLAVVWWLTRRRDRDET